MAPPAAIETGVSSEKLRISDKIYARVRLATEADVSHIYKLFYQIHEYHSLTHLYKVSEDSLSDMLFKTNPNRPFYSPTILLAEVSATEFPAPTTDAATGFQPIVQAFDLKAPVADDDCAAFRSTAADHHDAYIAGYAFFFPNYSCFYDRPGIFFESLYFRASYRKLGLGRVLFSTVATNAATMGFSSVEGIVAAWNKKAFDFYIDMGVEIMDEFRYGKLYGDALQAYAKKKSF